MFYLLDVVNNARTPIDIGRPLLIELPTGVAGASIMQGSSPNASAQGDRLVVTGPFAPGKTVVQAGLSLPQAGAATTIRQRWPAAVARLFVGVEKIGNIQMSSPQDERYEGDVAQGGAVFIMGTGGRINAGEELVINLTGIPATARRFATRRWRWRRSFSVSAAGLRFRRRRRMRPWMRSCGPVARS